MNQKSISIIIPVYNSEKFLEKLLNSILVQTYKNYEVVIVNDGSTDRSLEIIEKFSHKFTKIKVVNIENSGPGIARKIGYENSTGDLLFFVDSDDIIPKDTVFQKIIEKYEKYNFDILIFNYIKKFSKNEQMTNAFYDKKLEEKEYGMEYLKKHMLIGALWSKIFVREKMSSNFFYDAKNYEDLYTTYRYLDGCKKFVYTKDILYCSNRDNENSISKNQDLIKVQKTIDLLKDLYSKSNLRESILLVMIDYYVVSRRYIDKSEDSKEKKKVAIKKAKELKKYYSFMQLISCHFGIKFYIKYIYYILKDIIYGI